MIKFFLNKYIKKIKELLAVDKANIHKGSPWAT